MLKELRSVVTLFLFTVSGQYILPTKIDCKKIWTVFFPQQYIKFIDFSYSILLTWHIILLPLPLPTHSSMTYSLKLLDISGNQFGELPLEAIKNIHTLSRLEAHRYGIVC